MGGSSKFELAAIEWECGFGTGCSRKARFSRPLACPRSLLGRDSRSFRASLRREEESDRFDKSRSETRPDSRSRGSMGRRSDSWGSRLSKRPTSLGSRGSRAISLGSRRSLGSLESLTSRVGIGSRLSLGASRRSTRRSAGRSTGTPSCPRKCPGIGTSGRLGRLWGSPPSLDAADGGREPSLRGPDEGLTAGVAATGFGVDGRLLCEGTLSLLASSLDAPFSWTADLVALGSVLTCPP